MVGLVLVCYGAVRTVMTLTGLNHHEFRQLLAGTGATFLRVNAALLLGTLWTVPAGVAIGFHPKLARVAQPLVQILGSTISQATDSGNLDLLVAATVAMAAIVVTINRLVWRRLYRLAESRYRLEA